MGRYHLPTMKNGVDPEKLTKFYVAANHTFSHLFQSPKVVVSSHCFSACVVCQGFPWPLVSWKTLSMLLTIVVLKDGFLGWDRFHRHYPAATKPCASFYWVSSFVIRLSLALQKINILDSRLIFHKTSSFLFLWLINN